MHIQERTNTTLTTCTKMTEEVDRRHGVNGNSSGKGVGEDVPVQTPGGRLKFFKDGKFILELVRGCARDGERAGWVSVPRKTFWPPAAAPPTPPTPTAHLPRGERAASLSVSDDNSSIQSSPWQRDHCWKQSNPRKHISKELALYYCRPNTLSNSAIDSASRRKRRRPYDITRLESIVNGSKKNLTNGVCVDRKKNGDVDVVDGKGYRSEDAGDVAGDDRDRWADLDREKYYHMKLKKPYQYHKLRVYKKTKPSIKQRNLDKTVDRLREKIASLPVPVNAKLVNCKQEHAMVSPRKRILRELERVSLEDQGTKRRAKTTVPAVSAASHPGPSHAPHRPPSDAPPARKGSSYSISSLLSMPDDSPARRSPHSYTPSVKTESPSSVHSPDLSPSPDNYRYRYSTLTLGSPGQESPTPPPELAARYRSGYSSPYGRARTSPQCYTASPYRSPRDEWYVYGGYPPYLPPHVYRPPPPPPLWMQYAVSPGIPPGPWAPLPHPLITDHIPKDEPTSDLPLNLSKH